MGTFNSTIVVNIATLYADTGTAKLADLDKYIDAAKTQAGHGNQVVLTGPGPVWLYLAVAHALHGLATTLLYNSPATGDVVIFDHNPF